MWNEILHNYAYHPIQYFYAVLYYSVLCRTDNISLLCTFHLFCNFPNLIPSCLALSPDERTVEVAQRSDVMPSVFLLSLLFPFHNPSPLPSPLSFYSSLEASLNIQLSNLEISVNSINLQIEA